MIRFINLFNMASGHFNIQIFGIDVFTKSKCIALTIWNMRIVIYFRK
jgi:hypothetical protein